MSTLIVSNAFVHKHVQTEAATVWTIVHNLHRYPIVDAWALIGGELITILPDAVTYIDDETCSVTFNQATTGFATVA